MEIMFQILPIKKVTMLQSLIILISKCTAKKQLWPDYLHKDINKVFGDVRDSKLVNELVEKNEYIIHLASAVGVGQSMYEVEHYTSVNSLGTGVLLQAIVNNKNSVKKLILASSMSVYGEGVLFRQ